MASDDLETILLFFPRIISVDLIAFTIEINYFGFKLAKWSGPTIPLDIAFINKDGIIESIKELVPLRTGYVYSEADVLYALVVNKGWFAENNVKVGDKILNCRDNWWLVQYTVSK